MSRNFYIQNNAEAPSIVFKNSQPEGYSLVGPTDPLIDGLIIKKYNEYTEAGIAYYNNARVGWVKARDNGYLTSLQIYQLQQKLKYVKSNLIEGNWISAEYVLVNEVTVDAILTQALYDSLLLDFREYILNNY